MEQTKKTDSKVKGLLECICCKNKYDHMVLFTRKEGACRWNYGYPYSVDGLVELERGVTQGGKELVCFTSDLIEKYNLNKN